MWISRRPPTSYLALGSSRAYIWSSRGVWVNGQLLVQIPFEDAMKLAVTATKVQLFWTDENGQKHATAASAISVEELIREAGYD